MVRELITDALSARGAGAQTRLAREVGVAAQTVNKWVKGQTLPTRDKLPAIEKALAMTPGTLLAAAGFAAADVPDSLAERLGRLEAEVAELRRAIAPTDLRIAAGTGDPPSRIPATRATRTRPVVGFDPDVDEGAR